MKSFLSDAISRAGSQGGDANPTYQEYSAADQELLSVLESLKTNIKIVGCGGGGTNTIDRLSEVGISGAEIFAANTDAQHLLAVRARSFWDGVPLAGWGRERSRKWERKRRGKLRTRSGRC